MAPYEFLLGYRQKSFGDTENAPGLAESWDTSRDGLSYTFRIRKGVRWHNLPPVNGREFVADDVAWTYRQYATRSVVKSKYTVVANISVPDKYTVVFTLKAPYAAFLTTTLAADFVMLPHEVFEQDGTFASNPIGTGPWIFERWDRDTLLSFRANPDYWAMGADGKPLPYASAYKIFIYGDDAAVNAAIRTGQVDYYTPGVSGVDLVTASALRKDRPDLLYWDGQLSNYVGMQFNFAKKPWNDVRVRRALALGIDKDEIIAAAVVGDTVRSGFVPTPLTDWAWPLDKVKSKFAYDQKTAMEQLKTLGVPGTTADLVTNSSTGEGFKGVQVLASQLTQLGLKINIVVPRNVNDAQAVIRAGNFDLGYVTHGTSFEVDDWLTRYWATTGSGNWWGYSNPAFDKLASQQLQETDPAMRKTLVDQAQDLLFEDMPEVPICGRANLHKVINPRLKNVRLPHYTRETFKDIWIDG
jgi:peptide/nickel transport system substrate-binding protein